MAVGRGGTPPGWAVAASSQDRPWLGQPALGQPALAVRAGLIRRWRLAADKEYEAARNRLALDTFSSPDLGAGISVVILAVEPSYHADNAHWDDLAACLGCLGRQTLRSELFEIILVVSSASAVQADGTRPIHTSPRADAVVDSFRSARRFPRVRLVRLAQAGAGPARQAGTAAAAREYLTFIEVRDRVSDAFLEVLLSRADPTTVPLTPVIDVDRDGDQPHPGIAEAVQARAGVSLSPSELPAATALDAGKAAPTRLLRSVATSGECHDPVVFWTSALVLGRASLLVCGHQDGGTYFRRVDHPDSRRVSPPVERNDAHLDPLVARRLSTVAALDRLAPYSDATSLRLIRANADTELAAVATHLAERPATHEQVVTAMDRNPVFHLPCGRMNSALSRDLVVAYAFAPYADASAVVMAKRLRVGGRVADVVSNAMGQMREVDATINAISGPYVARLSQVPTPSHFSRWDAIEGFVIRGLETIRRWDRRRPAPERLYSRAHFAASHLLSAGYKLSRPEIRWRAEFSDPLSRDVLDQQRGSPVRPGPLHDILRGGMKRMRLSLPASDNSMVWSEEITYALADELVFTNENQLEHMLSYCTDRDLAAIARQKALISPHPTLHQRFYSMVDCDYPLEAGCVHLAYFGKLYANRGLDEVLHAIAAQKVAIRRTVRLHVFTRRPKLVHQLAVELGIGDCVRAGRQVRYLEFLNLLTRLDCLLVTDAATAGSHARNPYLPSKWSDYRGSGVPVWGLVEPGSPLSRQPLDYSSPVGDADAATEVIAHIGTRLRTGTDGMRSICPQFAPNPYVEGP